MTELAPNEAEQLIADVRKLLGHARQLLQDPAPRNIDSCYSDLFSAVELLTGLQRLMETSEGAVRCSAESAVMARNDVRVVSRLLETAASFHSNLLHRMLEASRSADAMSVTPDQVAPAQIRSRVPLTLSI
jgi:hypothetical protein